MTRRLPLIFVAAIIVICLAAAAVAAVAAGVGASPVAYRVNSTKVAQPKVDDELSWIANSPQIKKNVQQQGGTVSSSDGSISAGLAANWLNQRIEVDLLRQVAARRKVVVTKAALDKARNQVAKQVTGAPDGVKNTLADLGTYLAALKVASADLGTFLAPVVKRSEISVDPRYGSWNPRQGVCPPTGCGGG